MKRALAFVLTALALSCLSASAQVATPSLPMVPLGYCQLSNTTLASATPLSSCSNGIPTGATMAMLQAATDNVEYRDDGTAPTASVGMAIISGAQPWLYSGTLSKIQFISSGGTLNVSFYR